MRRQQRRRRRRDGAKEAYWRGHVEAHARSGLGVRAFCRERGLAENSFYAWRRELAVRDREPAAARDTTRASVSLQPASSAAFAEVVVTAPAERLPATPAIEIILAPACRSQPRRVAIAPGFDPATLTAVLDVLEQRPC